MVGRILHPFGLRADKVNVPQRIAGALLTGVVTIVAGIALILKFF